MSLGWAGGSLLHEALQDGNAMIKKSAHLFLLKKTFSPPYSTANPLLTCASFPSKEKMNRRRCQIKKIIEDDLIVQKVGADYRELWALAIFRPNTVFEGHISLSWTFESQGKWERLLLCCGNIEQTFSFWTCSVVGNTD